MAIEISEEDFALIREALRRATSPYTEDEIADVMIAERRAWAVVQRIDATQT